MRPPCPARAAVRRWNKKHPVGTAVKVRGTSKEIKTWHAAEVLSNTAVILGEDFRYYRLRRVTANEAAGK
jgi:hypothetical protein